MVNSVCKMFWFFSKTVYSYTGKMEKHTVIDLSNYQKGIYLLKVKTAGISTVQKVIRQ